MILLLLFFPMMHFSAQPNFALKARDTCVTKAGAAAQHGWGKVASGNDGWTLVSSQEKYDVYQSGHESLITRGNFNRS